MAFNVILIIIGINVFIRLKFLNFLIKSLVGGLIVVELQKLGEFIFFSNMIIARRFIVAESASDSQVLGTSVKNYFDWLAMRGTNIECPDEEGVVLAFQVNSEFFLIFKIYANACIHRNFTDFKILR